MNEVRLGEYFYLQVPERPGEGARILSSLKDAGVNLLAFSGFPAARRAQLDFIPEDASAFRAAAKKAGWKLVGPKRVFLIAGEDHPGALAVRVEVVRHRHARGDRGVGFPCGGAVAGPDERRASRALRRRRAACRDGRAALRLRGGQPPVDRPHDVRRAAEALGASGVKRAA